MWKSPVGAGGDDELVETQIPLEPVGPGRLAKRRRDMKNSKTKTKPK